MAEEEDQAPIDPRGRELSYVVVARRLRRRIEGGEWRDGAPIPSEPALTEWYGVSRTTVRSAIRILVSEGLLEVVPGKGTYVAPRKELCDTPCHTVERGGILTRDTVYHTRRMREVDRASRVPPWRQIAAVLRQEIADGKYSPDGRALPSVNRLSQEWGVARRTAHKALQSLADEGLIEAETGMGYYIKRR